MYFFFWLYRYRISQKISRKSIGDTAPDTPVQKYRRYRCRYCKSIADKVSVSVPILTSLFVIINQSILFAPRTSTFLSPLHPPLTLVLVLFVRPLLSFGTQYPSQARTILTSPTINTFKHSEITHYFCFPPA